MCVFCLCVCVVVVCLFVLLLFLSAFFCLKNVNMREGAGEKWDVGRFVVNKYFSS